MDKKIIVVCIACMCMSNARAQTIESDTVCVFDSMGQQNYADSVAHAVCYNDTEQKPQLIKALGEVVATDLFIHGLCRIVLNKPYSHTSLHTIHENLRTTPMWDNDPFNINHIGHPFQGSMHFNCARTNGFNFWQSIPFSLTGSYLWELTCESDPPSLNDLVTTTISGACIGEVTYRLSGCILKDRDRGVTRFLRETAAAIINPIRGFNRLVSGKAWHVRRSVGTSSHNYSNCNCDYESEDEHSGERFSLTLGDRYLSHSGKLNDGRHNPFAAIYMEYGIAADGENHSRPYDFFTLDAEISLSKNQPLLSRMHITGRLLSRQQGTYGELGLYQHFSYYEAHIKDKQAPSPFPYGEMASVGPGFIWAHPSLTHKISMDQRVFFSGIVMGAIKSDHYSYDERKYNFGSGFSTATQSRLYLYGIGGIDLQTHYMHLFTWKGYETKNLENVDSKHVNVQGDRSHSRLLSIRLNTYVHIAETLALKIDATYTTRHTSYKYFPKCHANSYEYRVALSWLF